MLRVGCSREASPRRLRGARPLVVLRTARIRFIDVTQHEEGIHQYFSPSPVQKCNDIFSAVHQEHKCVEVFVDIKITDAVRSEAAQREAPETETITQCKSPLNALHFPFRPDECLKA